MVMIDAQTVKGGRYGPTFHNAGGRGGRTIGTKRTILVEIPGLPLSARADPAKPHDVRAGRDLLRDSLAGLPRVGAIVADRGYRGLRALAAGRHLRLDIKAPPKGQVGFRPIAPLYKVEHAFAQLGRWRRLSRCYEGSEASATAWLEVASAGELPFGWIRPIDRPGLKSSAVRIGTGAVDVDVLRAGPNADDEELCRIVGGGDLAMHHPGGIEDEVPGHRRHLLAPGGTVFDRDPAAEHVDVGVARSMVVPATRESGVGPHPADPAILMVEELSAVHSGRGWPGWRGPLIWPDHDRSSLLHSCSPRRLAWAPCPTLCQTSRPRTCAGPERYTVSPTALGFHTQALSLRPVVALKG